MNPPQDKNQSQGRIPKGHIAKVVESPKLDTEDNLKKEILKKAHEGYVCSGDGNPELCYICDCIYRAINFTKAETNEQIELARASGYNEECYVHQEKIKELTNKLADSIYYKSAEEAVERAKSEILREIKELDVTPNDDDFYTIPSEKLKELEQTKK